MRKISLLIGMMGLSCGLIAGKNPHQKQYNFDSFSHREKKISSELDSITPAHFKSHPEYGTLPVNTPCTDCIELEDHRDATSRYFVANRSGGKHFYKQQSYGAINYRDAAGWWKEINSRLKPKPGNVFEADDQPSPVKINLREKFSSVKNGEAEIRFNKNLRLYHVDQNGNTESLGTPDWSHFSAGDDGILVKDFYPGIDLQLLAFEGMLKTNFILNNRLTYPDGWLVMKQNVELPSGLAFDLSETRKNENNRLLGELIIREHTREYFRFHSSVAYDANAQPGIIELGNELNPENELLTYIPLRWLNDSRTSYPVVIDPLVSSTGTVAQASITGSQYNAVCWTGGCTYNLSFLSPANSTITDISSNFDYIALGLCTMPDGGVSFNYGSCRSPAAGAYTCPLPATGTCFSGTTSLFSDFTSCVPPPHCSADTMNFNMNFYRCNNGVAAGCNSTCIAAASAWSIIVEGETVRVKPGSLTPNLLICEGDTAMLYVVAQYGVPPYSFAWSPSGSANDTIFVTPASTTTYQILITDSCGLTTLDSTTVNVTANNNPGFTFSPNPVCTGQNVTFTGLGAGAFTNYDWLIPGSNNPVVNNSKITSTQYPVQGTYIATLNYSNGTCIFPDTQTVSVYNFVTPSVSISSNVPSPACTGSTVVFTATPVNGGTAPSFQWQVNGVNAGTNSDTFSVSLSSPSVISVAMTSNYQCLNIPGAVVQVLMSVVAPVSPSVNISAIPSFPVCAGTNIVFTATPTLGGSAPSYQWQLNGVNTGTNSDTFSISTFANGDLISVVMTSNSGCVSTTTASDTMHAIVSPGIIPAISFSVSPNDTICAGSNVQFTAIPVNGGTTPSYQWWLNGVPVAGAVFNSYATNTITNGNSIKLTMTSGLSCANPATVSDSLTMHTTPAVAPVVNINISPNDTVCAGTTVVFTAVPTNGGTAPSYQWKVNGVNAGTNSDTFSVVLSTTATISVRMTSNYTCLSSLAANRAVLINVISSATPSVNITSAPVAPYCPGATVVFTATPTFGGTSPSYQWQVNGFNAGTNSANFSTSTLVNGDLIRVTMTSNFGCVSPATATDTVYASVLSNLVPAVSISANPGLNFCLGSSVTFTANPVNGGSSPAYQWYLNGSPAGTGNAISSSALNSQDTISVVMTSGLSCASPSTDSTAVVVTQVASSPAGVSLTANPAGSNCAGTQISFSATPFNGGTIPVFGWFVNSVQVPGAVSDTFSISSLSNGDMVSVSMMSDLTCAVPATATDSLVMTVTPVVNPSISISVTPNDTACTGDNLQFSASGLNGGSAPVYQWLLNGGNTGTNSATFTSSTLNDGDTITVSFLSNAICAVPAQVVSSRVVVTIKPLVVPAVSITSSPPGTICIGETVSFQATPVNGGINPAYQWNVNGVVFAGNNSSFTSSALVQGDAVSVQMTSGETCAMPDSAISNTITINTYPAVNLQAAGSAIICPDVPVTLQAFASGGKGGPYLYSWSNGAGNNSIVQVTPSVSTTYVVSATDACATNAATASVRVTVMPGPTALYSYTPNDPSAYEPEVSFTDLSTNVMNWFWNFGDGDSSTLQNPVHSFPTVGTYDVALAVMSANGCHDTISSTIIVKENIAFFVPNSFTPNGDGKNETFAPMGIGFSDYEMTIYDRWGNEIFKGGPLNAWTGTIGNGKTLASDGIYLYNIHLKNPSLDKVLTGRITLIR